MTNETGAIVGLGTLAYAAPVQIGQCVYTYSVVDLPAADFYGIEVGHRGAVRYSAADLQATGLKIGPTLGR